jgi:uncharacterized membrane protein YfcA
MARIRRILAVTAGLAAAGALTGAACGVLALTPLLVTHLLHPDLDRLFATVAFFAPRAAAVGAAFGVVAGPLLAWSLLRHVPLWRVILWAAAGTVVGSFYGLAAGSRLPALFPAVISGALLGMAAGSVLLRRRVGRETHVGTPPALPNVR